ncbi:MAG: HNH endonuclease, partial [bacterium]
FTNGMAWKNYGEWHVDHIIPRSVFNYEKAEDVDFKRCWALDNLQPLWGIENISKGNKLDADFQPALLLEVGHG